MKKEKYIVLECAKVGNVFKVQRKKDIAPKTTTYSIGKSKAHHISIDAPTFEWGQKHFYVVHYIEGQMSFNKLREYTNAETNDAILLKGLFKQAITPLGKIGGNLPYILIIALIGLGVGIGWIAKGVVG